MSGIGVCAGAGAMGFPVYPDLAEASGVPMDASWADMPAIAVGNAMHTANVGSVSFLAMLATEPVTTATGC